MLLCATSCSVVLSSQVSASKKVQFQVKRCVGVCVCVRAANEKVGTWRGVADVA